MKSIAIVGAGLRGLASAAYLKSAGHRVCVFEKTGAYGGIWTRVSEHAQINTPYYGYTFHPTNLWESHRPRKREILENLERMVTAEGLESSIRLNSPVRGVSRPEPGRWLINGDSEAFDAVLVCTGFLDQQRRPPKELIRGFEGELLLPYSFDVAWLAGRNVTIVGSGATALDMLVAAHGSGAKNANLIVKPGAGIHDIGAVYHAIHAVKSNPLLYRLTKRKGAVAGAARVGITRVLQAENVRLRDRQIEAIEERETVLAGGERLKTDVLVWCTGWDSPVPPWVDDYAGDPTLVTATCPSCLDTAGFGYGSATAHAKALRAALEHGFTEQFKSGSHECDCAQEQATFSRHIVLSLMLYYWRHPGGGRVLLRGLKDGLKSNRERWRRVDEPGWSRALAFLNAPLGF